MKKKIGYVLRSLGILTVFCSLILLTPLVMSGLGEVGVASLVLTIAALDHIGQHVQTYASQHPWWLGLTALFLGTFLYALGIKIVPVPEGASSPSPAK